jgi:hypothetical protein
VLPGFWLPGFVSIEMREDNGKRSAFEEIADSRTAGWLGRQALERENSSETVF